MNHEFLWNKKRLWFWILLGVAFVLSFVTPLRLDEGGELTCFSMLVICLIGYFLGGSKGVLAAVIYGVLMRISWRRSLMIWWELGVWEHVACCFRRKRSCNLKMRFCWQRFCGMQKVYGIVFSFITGRI